MSLPGYLKRTHGFVLKLGGRIGSLPESCYEHACDGIAQPDAVVTVTGECDYDECADAAGTYAFLDGQLDLPVLRWFWEKLGPGDSEWILCVYFDSGTCEWAASLWGWIPAANPWSNLVFYGEASLACDPDLRELVGAFDMPGWDPYQGGYDCTGCTAHATLGGP
jgi:hypothetical protein